MLKFWHCQLSIVMSWTAVPGQQFLVSQKRLPGVMHVEKAAVSHPLRDVMSGRVGGVESSCMRYSDKAQTITQWQPLLSFSFLVGSGDGGHSCSWNFLRDEREMFVFLTQ